VATTEIRYQVGRKHRVLKPGEIVPKKHFPKANLRGLFQMRQIDPVSPVTEGSEQIPSAGEAAA
jgi:hypothetical protein